MTLQEIMDQIGSSINDSTTQDYWVGMLRQDKVDLADDIQSGKSTVEETIVLLTKWAGENE